MKEETRQLLNDNNIDKVEFYYQTTPLVNNVFTTCLLINSKLKRIEARGVSICSLMDVFSKTKGKQKALGRAVKALKRKGNFYKINASGRVDEFTQRSLKIKSATEEERFRTEVAAELMRIDPSLPVQISSTSGTVFKKVQYELPLNYPISVANRYYKYKSQFRPEPNEIELNMLRSETLQN